MKTQIELPTFHLNLPEWLKDYIGDPDTIYETMEERMALVIGLARENIRQKTGGPFGAAIFDLNSKKLIMPGVNMVTSTNCSVIHAEIAAYIFAQQKLKTFDLGSKGLPDCELVTSVEPCAMCLGATCWSGVRQVVIGAREKDAAAIGFDEGPKKANWVEELKKRGIQVYQDILSEKAAAVLTEYAENSGLIYNGRND